MRRRTEPGRPPRATAPVAVALSAAATLTMVAIAYTGAANPSVPGAITFGPVSAHARSTASTGPDPADLAADPAVPVGSVSPPAADQTTTLTDPSTGRHPVTSGSDSEPSLAASAPPGGGPGGATTSPVGSSGRTVPTDSSAAVVAPTVTPSASTSPTTSPPATLVAPPPPVTTPVAPVPPVTTTGGTGTASTKTHGIPGSRGAAPAPSGHGPTAASSPASSAAPSVVAPQYPVVNAQSAGDPAKGHSGNDQAGNQPGSNPGASKGD